MIQIRGAAPHSCTQEPARDDVRKFAGCWATSTFFLPSIARYQIVGSSRDMAELNMVLTSSTFVPACLEDVSLYLTRSEAAIAPGSRTLAVKHRVASYIFCQ